MNLQQGRPPALSRRLARNAGFILFSRLWFIAIWMLVTPIVLAKLGPERFGVWSLLFLLSGYLATFDLGIGTSVVKFTAEFAATREWERLEEIVLEMLKLYLVLGVVWVVAIFLGQSLLLKSLHISAAHLQEVRFALLASSIIFAFANLISVATGMLNGMQRMDLSNGIMVAASLPQLAILLYGLSRGYGLYAVVAGTALQWLVTGALAWVALRRIVPDIRWRRRAGRLNPGRWLRFSALIQINNVLALSQLQIDKALMALWLGVSAVTPFELGFRVANSAQSLPVLLLHPLLPMFAQLNADENRERFRRLCVDGTAVLSAIAFALAAGGIPAAPLIIRAWVGSGYPVAELLAQWLLAGFALNMCTGVATTATRGAGRPALETLPATIALAIHVLASWVFVSRYGAVGVGPSFFLSLAAWTGLFLIRFSRWSGEGPGVYARAVLARPLVAFLPAAALGWILAMRWMARLDVSRVELLTGAAISAGAAGLVFAAIWWVAGGRRLLRSLTELR